MRPPPYGGIGKCQATSNVTPRLGASGRGSSTRIIVPSTFVVSGRPFAAKRSTVIPPTNPFALKSKTTPPANRSGGRFSTLEIELGGGGEDVLIELQPDVRERFRRAVDVVDPASAGQHVRRGVERCLECVVGALLPVARARSSRGAAHRRGTRQRQLPKRGGVGDGLLKREQQQEHAVLLVSRDYTCGTIRDGHHGEHGIHSGRARERARVRHIQATYTPHPVF